MSATLLNCDEAASAIHAGKLIAYPTEAIYGLGCDPNNQQALEQLLNLKLRDKDKGLILVASHWQQLEPFVSTTSDQLSLAQSSWPGPVTWIMPAGKQCTPILTGGRDTIAVRISALDVVKEFCDSCDHALVSTSANISGRPPLKTPADIFDAFGEGISGVLEGELGGLENATSIFDVRTGVQLR